MVVMKALLTAGETDLLMDLMLVVTMVEMLVHLKELLWAERKAEKWDVMMVALMDVEMVARSADEMAVPMVDG